MRILEDTFIRNSGINPRYDLWSGVENGIKININKHNVTVVVEINENVTLCPILSDMNPNIGPIKIQTINTLLVRKPASIWSNPYLTARKSFEIILKRSPRLENTHIDMNIQ